MPMAASPGRRRTLPISSAAPFDWRQKRLTAEQHPERQRRQLYGRRKGPKLSAHQQHLIDTLLPKLALKLEQGADPKTYFSSPPCGEVGGRSDPGGERCSTSVPHPKNSSNFSTSPQGGGKTGITDVWLEVGFGAGEHLLWQAQHHPPVGMIGAEPYISGVAKLLSKIDGLQTPNIRLHTGDARDIVDALPDASLGCVFILFPDPWPKTRHHKRRFVQTDLLDRLACVMKPGAELRFASDDAPYFEWTLERVRAHPQFEWMAARSADWLTRPEGWPQTRYEAKELHGKPAYLRARRR
jgi:tRNA (guanine-N7-)-methyltransferase